MSLFQASQHRATISSYDLKVRLDNQLSRMNCQMFSTGFSSGDRGGSDRSVIFGGITSLTRGMPPGLIKDENGVGARRDLGGDFIQMPLHCLGVTAGQNQGRHRRHALRTNGAKYIG